MVVNIPLKEADVLSTVVEHKFTAVLLSDVDYDTLYCAFTNNVKSGDEFTASRTESLFLEMTDLAGQDLLLHPAWVICLLVCSICMHTRQTALLL